MADGFPGGGQESQPTVLVSGRPRESMRRVPLGLFGHRARHGDGLLIVSTRDDPAFLGRQLTDGETALDSDRLALVDCTTKHLGEVTRTGDLQWEAPSPVSFEHARQAVDEGLAALHDRGAERVHVLFDTLTTQFRLADADAVLQHAHDLAMTFGGESGLGIFTVEHAVATDQESERLKHLVDVHVEVRRGEDGPEVRWTGLVGNSGGWVTFSDSGIRFDSLGRRPTDRRQ